MKHAITLLIAWFGTLSMLSSQNLFSNPHQFINSTYLEDWNNDLNSNYIDAPFYQDIYPNRFLLKNSINSLPHSWNPFKPISALSISTYIGSIVGSTLPPAKEDVGDTKSASTVGIPTEQFLAPAFAKPSNGFIPIKVNNWDTESSLKVFKVNGELVYETKLESQETQLNIKQLEYGYYIVEYSSKKEGWRLPLIKH